MKMPSVINLCGGRYGVCIVGGAGSELIEGMLEHVQGHGNSLSLYVACPHIGKSIK